MIRSFLITFLAIFAFILTIQAADTADHRELLSKHYRLQKPDGAGPFPAVIMVPGCSGFDADFQKEFYDSVQSQLVKLGFVTLRVNYQAARNVPICWPHVPTEDVAGDIRIAAEYLRQRTFSKRGLLTLWGGRMALRVHSRR